MSTSPFERDQAEGELARFIRDRAGERHYITALAEAIPQLVWTARPDGWIDYCNRRCLDYLGLDLDQIRGWTWQSVIHPVDVQVSLERWRRALDTGDVFEIEYRIRGAGGAYRWFLGRALPVRDDEGRIVKWFGTSTDIDAQKRAEERIAELNTQLRQRVAELQTLLDVLPVGIAIAEDAACDRVRLNRHFLQKWGLSRETNFSPNSPRDERPGRYEVYRGGVPVAAEDLPMKVAAARGVEVLGEELDLVLGDGRVLNVCVDAAPLFDEHGRPRGSVAAIRDVTDRNRVERELQAAKDAAESASRAKDQFLAMLGHELRTPLTPVLMAASALAEDAETPPQLLPTFAMIRRNVELEARLIDDLLDVMRIIRGKMPCRFELVHAHALIERTLEICRSEVVAKDIRLVTDLAAADDRVRADPARLQQVLWNLVKNAVKFTPAGGTITVKSRDGDDRGDGGRLVIEVSDTGIGIAADALPRVFDAFEQGGDEVTRRYGGMGLGLAISRPIVEAHGGSLTASSDGDGRGATFRLELATAPDAGPDAGPAEPATAPTPRGLRVLLVEDNALTADVMADTMRRRGYEVTTAYSFARALEAASADFDVVVSDIDLGDGSGLDLMRHVRDRSGARGIALSGFATEDDIRRSQEAGFVVHLAKPVTVAELEAAVRRVISTAPGSTPPRDDAAS